MQSRLLFTTILMLLVAFATVPARAAGDEGIRVARYSLLTSTAKPEQAHLLAAVVTVHFPDPAVRTVADWIQAALFTGCRKEELLGLEWERVDLQKNTLYLEAHHNKSKRRQSVPLHPMAREAILSRARFRMEHCPESPWVFCTRGGDRIKDIKRAFASACRRAGIVDFTPHDCRHTLASWLAMGGVPLAAIKDLLRHSSITVTERYAHLAPETARKGLDTLNVTFLSRSETLTNTDDVSA